MPLAQATRDNLERGRDGAAERCRRPAGKDPGHAGQRLLQREAARRGLEALGFDPYMATGGNAITHRRRGGRAAGRRGDGQGKDGGEAADTRRGKALYARRKAIVEPVFGQIKGVRGFRRFLLRGLAKFGGNGGWCA